MGHTGRTINASAKPAQPPPVASLTKPKPLLKSRSAAPHVPRLSAVAMSNQESCTKVPTKSASLKKSAAPDTAPDDATAAPAHTEAMSEAMPEAAPESTKEAPAPVITPTIAAATGTPPAVAANDSTPAPAPAAPPAAPQVAAAAPASAHQSAPRPQGGIPGRVMPPPRPMAKAENFVEGDHVVYPTHGVGKVERIATEEIAGHKLELIHITFEENRMTLRVPVAKARTAGLRKLATRKMFDEAMAVLKGRARIKRTMWSRRAQEYEAKINSGDPLAIAEVVRDLHRNAGQPDQSFSERQIYEAAMDRLAAELGALDRIDKNAALVKLTDFLKTV